MEEKPLISIILPTYNGSRYLPLSVESCLIQTYENWELIIVDDASIDNTRDIINKYTRLDHRIKAIFHETNKRVPGALNNGFKSAKGTYFTWTSDDNYYRPNALQEMIEFLQKNQNVDIVYTDYTKINNAGVEMGKQLVENPDKLIYRNCVGACFLYKKKVNDVLQGYAEDYFLAEDYDFWLRASKEFILKSLHKDLYCYRLHSDSLTQQRKENCIIASKKVQERNFPSKADYKKILSNRPVYIWGSGSLGKLTFKILNEIGIAVEGFLDNDPVKWGKSVFGKIIRKPSILENSYSCVPYIVIGSSYVEEIERQLESVGLVKEFDYIDNWIYLQKAFVKKNV